MVLTKKMNESSFAQILKEYNALGELIRARQDEKQAILDQFDSESKRFYFGKISENALESSIRKTNKELNRLDREVNQTISKAKNLGSRMDALIKFQKPKVFRATLTGVSSSVPTDVKKRKVVKKKKAVKKVVKKKTARKKKK